MSKYGLQLVKIATLSSASYSCFFFFLKHFQDGRRAQQHIENSWKQLETVSDLSAPITMLICIIPILFKLLSVDCAFRPTSQPNSK